jgi:hypothetical protein
MLPGSFVLPGEIVLARRNALELSGYFEENFSARDSEVMWAA